MKRFYLALSALAVAGVALIAYAASRPAARAPAEPVNLAALAAADTFHGYVSGSDSAPVEVVEYADFECPGCANFATVQLPTIREQLIATGRLRWRFRDFPLQMHQWSRLASHAAACAAEQGRFEAMHDLLFARHEEWAGARRSPQGTFRQFARDAGVDVGRWDPCMDSQRYAGRIEASYQEAVRLGVPHTPSFIIGDRFVEINNSDHLKAIVDSLGRRRGR